MKVYYICECCEQVFSVVEADGPEGAATVHGICDECAFEIGMMEDTSLHAHFYS
jgi:hypothetical protein